MVLDALGETVWSWYVLVLGMEVPYPSVADVFYLLSYPPIILGLYLYVKMFGEVVPRKRVARVVAAGLVISYFTISAILAEAEEPLVAALDITYPSLDVVILVLAHVGLFIFMEDRLAKAGLRWS